MRLRIEQNVHSRKDSDVALNVSSSIRWQEGSLSSTAGSTLEVRISKLAARTGEPLGFAMLQNDWDTLALPLHTTRIGMSCGLTAGRLHACWLGRDSEARLCVYSVHLGQH
jgi:hypothetical protein